MGIGYRFSACDAVLAYRHIGWDIGGTAIDDIDVVGPMRGVRFDF